MEPPPQWSRVPLSDLKSFSWTNRVLKPEGNRRGNWSVNCVSGKVYIGRGKRARLPADDEAAHSRRKREKGLQKPVGPQPIHALKLIQPTHG